MFQPGIDEQEPTEKKFYGKYPGLVLNNAAPEKGDHLGVLLVEIPGIPEDAPNGDDRHPMQVFAKPCFQPGFFMIPEVNAQVWVEFAAGDLNTPIWTGVWYPQGKTPKTADDKAPTVFQKVIHTASGHIIQFDDTKEQGTLIVKVVAGEKANMITIDKNGITIEAAGKVRIKGSVDIDGALTVGIGPKTTITGNEITGG